MLNLLSPKIKLAIGAVIISFSGVFVKASAVAPESASFFRCAFGAAAYLIFLLITKRFKIKCGRWIIFPAAAGIMFAADLFCWHQSIYFVGPGLSTLLGNFQVFLVAAAGFILFSEKIRYQFILSCLAAFAGLFLIIRGNINTAGEYFIPGVILGLATSVFYAGYVILLKKSQHGKTHASVNMFIVSVVTAVVSLGYILSKGSLPHIATGKGLVLMLAYGFICQFVAWLLISSSLKSVKASTAGILLILQPVFSYVWDILLFGKQTGTLEAIGAIICAAAVYAGIRYSSQVNIQRDEELSRRSSSL